MSFNGDEMKGGQMCEHLGPHSCSTTTAQQLCVCVWESLKPLQRMLSNTEEACVHSEACCCEDDQAVAL